MQRGRMKKTKRSDAHQNHDDSEEEDVDPNNLASLLKSAQIIHKFDNAYRKHDALIPPLHSPSAMPRASSSAFRAPH